MTPEQRGKGLYVEFNLNNLLRGDAKTRAELYASARQWGWMSPNDIRRLENMNPIPNGDTYSSPLNMTALGNDTLDEKYRVPKTSVQPNQTKETAQVIQDLITRGDKA
jgi:hypothetical protein